MNKPLNPQYITDEHGKGVSVVLSIQQWQQIIDKLEDIRFYDEVKARNEPTILLIDYKKKPHQTNA